QSTVAAMATNNTKTRNAGSRGHLPIPSGSSGSLRGLGSNSGPRPLYRILQELKGLGAVRSSGTDPSRRDIAEPSRMTTNPVPDTVPELGHPDLDSCGTREASRDTALSSCDTKPLSAASPLRFYGTIPASCHTAPADCVTLLANGVTQHPRGASQLEGTVTRFAGAV